jgi:hypothetical protein
MPSAPAAGEWHGITEDSLNYIDITLTLTQKGFQVSGIAKCIYYENKLAVLTEDYDCTGSINKTVFNVSFGRSDLMHYYSASLFVTTQRFNGILTSVSIKGGKQDTLKANLVLQKTK